MRRWLQRAMCAALFTLAFALAIAERARAEASGSRARKVADAITELDVRGAQRMLEEGESDSATLTFERARLAIYTGDCDGASAILSVPVFGATPEGASLGELARNCARATAASVVVEDAARGVWIRLQDEADRALVPFIVDVSARARAAIARDLGTELPRPLRIDLVRDLFSLSCVSGLPLSAAETTGTVAVARWGRITMLSPRATPLGYQWEDTLAHEITHLALSRATRDRAPLWLQEGIAKREETRWRNPRPFDNSPAADAIAHAALLGGRSVGVDRLGPSIALLPTPDAASTAFAEVTSFMSYWVDQNGELGLKLLLADLKGLGSDDPNQALRSVSGYDLPAWIRLWQSQLRSQHSRDSKQPSARRLARPGVDPAPAEDLSRRVRLGDLLMAREYWTAAAKQLEPAVQIAPKEPAVRWRAARAMLGADRGEAAQKALGSPNDIGSVYGAWFALHGRFMKQAGELALAERAFELGIAADPLLEDVACEGQWRLRHAASRQSEPSLPTNPARRALCEAARAVPRD